MNTDTLLLVGFIVVGCYLLYSCMSKKNTEGYENTYLNSPPDSPQNSNCLIQTPTDTYANLISDVPLIPAALSKPIDNGQCAHLETTCRYGNYPGFCAGGMCYPNNAYNVMGTNQKYKNLMNL